MAYPASEPVEEIGSAWRETRTGMCSRDMKIRSFGWRIHSRPRTGPILWERIKPGIPIGRGEPIPQSMVEVLVAREETRRKAAEKSR